ncbi:MAG TPA: winged helix-turn-helix transcriptional regulator [Polyangiaceae bacterium]|nr:winged helix-turn-helix transcriptional regulator [Polyangiaceae bacterium]
MTQARKYRLLCPIARALDRVGDRWALLILRDLHAGPARFSELLDGLTGIASNLLSSRLEELLAAELIRKVAGPHQVTVYELTPLGLSTANLLYELAAFGSRLPPDDDVRPPGNRRTIAVTLKVACSRIVDPNLTLEMELRIDREPFTLRADGGQVDVWARPATAPRVVLETDYESMLAVTDGAIDLQAFARRVKVTSSDPGAMQQAFELLGNAVQRIAQDAPEGASRKRRRR